MYIHIYALLGVRGIVCIGSSKMESMPGLHQFVCVVVLESVPQVQENLRSEEIRSSIHNTADKGARLLDIVENLENAIRC